MSNKYACQSDFFKDPKRWWGNIQEDFSRFSMFGKPRTIITETINFNVNSQLISKYELIPILSW